MKKMLLAAFNAAARKTIARVYVARLILMIAGAAASTVVLAIYARNGVAIASAFLAFAILSFCYMVVMPKDADIAKAFPYRKALPNRQ